MPEDSVDIVATGPNPNNGIFGIDKGVIFKTDAKDTAIGVVNSELADNGYSYLLITKGYGCLATCLTSNFDKIGEYFDKSKDFLLDRLDVPFSDVKRVGGMGSFSLEGRLKDGDRLYVGEAASLQDFLWGFGIRTAITSGHLAARSIIDGEDYEENAKQHFTNRLKASVVNRYFWEKDSKRGYPLIFWAITSSKDASKFLRSFYNFNLFQRLVFPFASRHFRKNYPHLQDRKSVSQE